MRPVRALTLAIIAAAVMAGPVKADTLTFQEAVGGSPAGSPNVTADTYIKSSSGSTNYGSSSFFYVGSNTGATVVGLVGFPNLFGNNPGQIPLGSTITSATLSLCVASSGPYPTISFYMSNVPWTESGATYNNFGGEAGVQADERGALVGTITAAAMHSGPGNTVNVTSAVQAWANGTPNNGLILTASPNCEVKFGASENTSKGEHPLLTVTYTPPSGPGPNNPVPEPASMALLGIGGLFAARMFRRKGPDTPAVA